MNLRSLRTPHPLRTCCILLLALALGTQGGAAQGFGTPPTKLPQDTGRAALRQMLRRLQTTARLMETTAHPDDEDGAMLTLESRGKGATVLSLTLTRGEGGQNRTGSNLFDLLGILRTLEVMASDEYYGAEQRFTRVADFGFSKTPEETLQKWQGGEPALADMVRVIRQFRPDVIVSRFQGSARDGHGHHQASGILTRQAFRAAGDPNKFPEQIKEGLQPWQAEKLYVDNVRGSEDYTLSLDTGVVDPVLGMSYVQMAVEGLKHQQSQGVGFRTVTPGPRLSYYKLVDSVLPMPAPGTHEQSFFDGIDTTLPGLAARLGDDEKKAPFLRPALVDVQKKIGEAATTAEVNDPSTSAAPLLAALRVLDSVLPKLGSSALSQPARQDLLSHLQEKRSQLYEAVSLALNVAVSAVVKTNQRDFIAVPGERFMVAATVINHGARAIQIKGVELQAPSGWKVVPEPQPKTVVAGKQEGMAFWVTPPPDAAYTLPWEHRPDPERNSVYQVDATRYAALPFPPPPLHIVARYAAEEICGDKPARGCSEASVSSAVEVTDSGPDNQPALRPLAVAPAFSVLLEPTTQIIAIGQGSATAAAVHVHSNLPGRAEAGVRLELPPGWRAEPASLPVKFDGANPDQTLKFRILPGQLAEKTYTLKAVLEYQGKQYAEGYTVVTRPDLGQFFYYQPATQRISAVDLKLPAGLKLGYIMGAGDDIPTVLRQAGLDVHILTPDELAKGDLSQFGTIVVGIRAYDVRDDVRANNQRLLDFVNNGGTLVVQYNANTGDFNSGHYTPYPAELSRERVTVEEAPVDLLAPQDGLFRFPNQIAARDFDGWVQERGLYFMDNWDPHFEPLLACNDPGESPQKGGLLRAHYGEGTYIYTGYAFFRQLPAGVPGAVRLFVNLISAGHESAGR